MKTSKRTSVVGAKIGNAFMLKLATWIVFVVCCPFAYFVIFLPVGNMVRPDLIRGSDAAIGFFWMNLYGIIPALLLIILVLFQRRTVRRLVVGIWAIPAVIVLCTFGVMAVMMATSP